MSGPKVCSKSAVDALRTVGLMSTKTVGHNLKLTEVCGKLIRTPLVDWRFFHEKNSTAPPHTCGGSAADFRVQGPLWRIPLRVHLRLRAKPTRRICHRSAGIRSDPQRIHSRLESAHLISLRPGHKQILLSTKNVVREKLVRDDYVR